MRRNYNILWLDDNFSKKGFSSGVESYKKGVYNHLVELGYIPNIIVAKNKEEVSIELSKNKKIDLFISDYNIDDDYKGIDFLKEARKTYNQEMVLYSNVSESDIKGYIIDHLSNDSLDLNLMSRFTFQSASNRKMLVDTINNTIDLTLIRWNELNALRGFYLAETSQIYEELKKYIENLADYNEIARILVKNKSQSKLFGRCDRLLNEVTNNCISTNLDFYDLQLMLFEYDSVEFGLFEKVRNIRNKCAHVKECEDANFEPYIELNDGSKIYECEIGNYRKLLFDFCDKVNSKYFSSVLIGS